jgi:hypothetical protein
MARRRSAERLGASAAHARTLEDTAMSEKKSKKKLNTRWRRGSARYDSKQQAEIDKKYHEPFGWKNGAKVSRR